MEVLTMSISLDTYIKHEIDSEDITEATFSDISDEFAVDLVNEAVQESTSYQLFNVPFE